MILIFVVMYPLPCVLTAGSFHAAAWFYVVHDSVKAPQAVRLHRTGFNTVIKTGEPADQRISAINVFQKIFSLITIRTEKSNFWKNGVWGNPSKKQP
jgi:hypothetical protein